MKNIRTPRSLAESTFTVGYESKPLTRSTGTHPSTWFVIIIGLIGLGIVIYTR
jgi:hypothetical protein